MATMNAMKDILKYTDSKYEGPWSDSGRMDAGDCKYTLTTKTRYEGEMKDGEYHGIGTLFFPDGGRYEAEWDKGKVVKGQYIFKDGLRFEEENWDYCTDVDRRFYSERCNGLRPSGRSQQTDEEPPIKIPSHMYDTGDGFYNAEERIVYKYNMEFLRNADEDEHDWIIRNCRKGWDEFVGLRTHPLKLEEVLNPIKP